VAHAQDQEQVGIKRRRERERQELRRAILAAAREIAVREGWQAVTIRKVAERIEYSPPMIYQYFASKDDLLLALLREGFAELTERLRAAQGTTPTAPEESLARVTEAYWSFAWERPELYQVMHGLGGVPFGTDATPPEARAAFAALRDAVRPVAGDAAALDDAVDLFWGALHGLVALAMAGRIAGGQRRATDIMGRAVRDLAQAWRTDGGAYIAPSFL